MVAAHGHAGGFGAVVAGRVLWIGIVPPPVPTDDIVHLAVAVVIHSVEIAVGKCAVVEAAVAVGVFGGVDPDVVVKIFVHPVHAGVDEGNRHGRVTRGQIPGVFRLQVGSVVGPLAGVVDVVGYSHDLVGQDRRRVFDIRIAHVPGSEGSRVGVLRNFEQAHGARA